MQSMQNRRRRASGAMQRKTERWPSG
ncbi:hypothetical protein L613_006800000200, partial [Pseudoxanthomonas taiwanensis J19]